MWLLNDKPVTLQIIRGYFMINLTSLAIIAAFFYGASWLVKDGFLWRNLAIIVCTPLVAMYVSWKYWAHIVTHWRITAFANTPTDDWLKLHRAAVNYKLYWPDDSWFEKTEIRTPAESAKIQEIQEHIQELRQIEAVADDFNTPPVLVIKYNRLNIIAEVFLFHATPFYLGLVGILSDNRRYLFGWILCVVGIGLVVRKRRLVSCLFRKGPAIIVDHQTVNVDGPTHLRLNWDSLIHLYVNEHSKQMTLGYWDEYGEELEISFSLDFYQIRDLIIFKRQMKVFADRYRFDLVE
jgi:hypothetical protein